MKNLQNLFWELLDNLKDRKVQGAIIAYLPAILHAFGVELMPEHMALVENIVIGVSSLLGLIGILYNPNKKGGQK